MRPSSHLTATTITGFSGGGWEKRQFWVFAGDRGGSGGWCWRRPVHLGRLVFAGDSGESEVGVDGDPTKSQNHKDGGANAGTNKHEGDEKHEHDGDIAMRRTKFVCVSLIHLYYALVKSTNSGKMFERGGKKKRELESGGFPPEKRERRERGTERKGGREE